MFTEHEVELANQIDELQVVDVCGCGDDFCQSCYTRPRPAGVIPTAMDEPAPSLLSPEWEGYLNLDVVDERIACVEVLYRPAVG